MNNQTARWSFTEELKTAWAQSMASDPDIRQIGISKMKEIIQELEMWNDRPPQAQTGLHAASHVGQAACG